MSPKARFVAVFVAVVTPVAIAAEPDRAPVAPKTGTVPAAPAPDAKPADTKSDIAALLGMMTGTFSSEAQAKADADYRHIVLHMAPIWVDRKDGPWLYVEQAMGPKDGKVYAPYRQRVYHLVADGTRVRSDVYTLPGDREEVIKNFTGAWSDPSKLAGLSPEKLTLRDGCSIMLQRQPDGTFMGATADKVCPSDLQGAAYATSQAHIRPDGMLTWDRGFDKEGKQVWGATKGGYQFVKQPGGVAAPASPEKSDKPAAPAAK